MRNAFAASLRVAAIVIAAAVAPSAQPSPILATLGEAELAAAIAAGESGKVSDGHMVYRTMFVGGPHVATFSTPWMRVAAAAQTAKRNYRKLAAKDVAPSLLVPELHVYAWAIPMGADVANVTSVVITPAKGKREQKAAAAIHPTRFETIPTDFKNLFGAEFNGQSKLAVFPLNLLTDDHEVHVVYDRVVDGGKGTLWCDDCAVSFKLKNVR